MDQHHDSSPRPNLSWIHVPVIHRVLVSLAYLSSSSSSTGVSVTVRLCRWSAITLVDLNLKTCEFVTCPTQSHDLVWICFPRSINTIISKFNHYTILLTDDDNLHHRQLHRTKRARWVMTMSMPELHWWGMKSVMSMSPYCLQYNDKPGYPPRHVICLFSLFQRSILELLFDALLRSDVISLFSHYFTISHLIHLILPRFCPVMLAPTFYEYFTTFHHFSLSFITSHHFYHIIHPYISDLVVFSFAFAALYLVFTLLRLVSFLLVFCLLSATSRLVSSYVSWRPLGLTPQHSPLQNSI
jgi:hypothetical protein